MGKQQKTEEQLTDSIFDIYSRYLDELSSDRRQVDFVQIYEVIICWCISYLGIKANEMGIEIYNVVQRIVNNKVQKNKQEFAKYLKAALYTAKVEYYRNNETGYIDIPRDTRKRLKMVDDIIVTKESAVGRKVTEDERRQCISEWFGVAEYASLMNLKNVAGLEFNHGKNYADREIDHLNSNVRPLYTEKASVDPHEEYLKKLGIQDIKGALERVLQNTHEKTRECYRALFTAYCIDKSIDFDGLTPFLDREILEAHLKDGKKPRRYEIYLKYHPEAKKTSAGAIASKMNKDFLKRLYAVL